MKSNIEQKVKERKITAQKIEERIKKAEQALNEAKAKKEDALNKDSQEAYLKACELERTAADQLQFIKAKAALEMKEKAIKYEDIKEGCQEYRKAAAELWESYLQKCINKEAELLAEAEQIEEKLIKIKEKYNEAYSVFKTDQPGKAQGITSPDAFIQQELNPLLDFTASYKGHKIYFESLNNPVLKIK